MDLKDNNYYVVLSFMVKDLGLKGTERDIYAIIYGLCQSRGKFTGSLQYLMDWTCTSKQGVINALNKLIEKNLIIKNDVYFNNVKFVEYYTNDFTTSQQSLPPSQESRQGGQQSLPNNIEYNNNYNIDKENIIINNNIKEIFDYWNSCDIIKHNNLTQDMVNVLKKLLDEFDIEQLQECIEHYSEAYHSEYQYCKYKWNLLTFFKQKNAWLEFLDDGSKWNNYLNWKKQNKPIKPNNDIELDLDAKPDTINGNIPNIELRAERYFENLYHTDIDKYYSELEKLKSKNKALADYVIKQVENGGFEVL